MADLGFGASPVTVVELARAVRAARADLRVVGLEQDPARVPPSPPEVELLAGGEAALRALGPCLVVRAMNVLRGYPRDRVAGLQAALGAALAEGGLLLEGSTDLEGRVTACHLLRRRGPGLVREGLLLHTDGTRGYGPWLFRDVLPRDLRREVRPGSPIHACLSEWAERLERRGAGLDPKARLLASLEDVPGLKATAWERAHGYLHLALPAGTL